MAETSNWLCMTCMKKLVLVDGHPAPKCCDAQKLEEIMIDNKTNDEVVMYNGTIQNVNTLLLNNLKDLYVCDTFSTIPIRNSPNISESVGVFGEFSYQNDIFLSIFDSCQAINSQIDDKEIKRIFRGIRAHMVLNKPSSQLEIFEPRGLHHIYLLVDGYCKMRCLFKDHNSNFIAIKEDYDAAEKLMHTIINTWSTVL